MGNFLTNSFYVLFFGLGILVINLFVGYRLAQLSNTRIARRLAWSHLVVSVALVHLLTLQEPAGFRMLGLCATMFYCAKGIVYLEERIQHNLKLSVLQWLCFSLGWFGMKPEIFAEFGNKHLPALEGVWRNFIYGLKRFLFGVALITGAWYFPKISYNFFSHVVEQKEIDWVISTTLLVGICLILHCGIFNFVAAFWRSRGVDARKLFRDPFHSRGLAEFWARRWNLAYVEFILGAVYVPLSQRLGNKLAGFLGFLITGILHDLAISLPVGAGFGLPTLYFAIQGLLVFFEQIMIERGQPIHDQEALSFIWTMLSLVLFLPLLFHGAYVRGVIWPIIGYSGL